MRNNNCGFLSVDEARDRLKERLMSDWIVIAGDSEAINKLEHVIYTPGTVKNADFELFGFPPFMGFIGKKTDDLKKLLNNPPDFDNLLMLIFHGSTEYGELTEQIGYTKDKNKRVSEIISVII